MNILQEIANRTKERIKARKKFFPIDKSQFTKCDFDFPFEAVLRSDDIAFICEIKKASPSKGIIAENFDYLQIAKDYEAAGAAAISVLTEPYWFMGSDDYLREISGEVKTPLLRKDFTVDSYMIYEAKMIGASAVLLICSVLDKNELAEYQQIAHEIGLSVLVETHDEREVETALSIGAKIIGVNNRNLKTFEVDLNLSERLRKLIPPDVIFVSESGITDATGVQKLREIGANAALIGESIMRSNDKKAAIKELRGY
ncbi:MAG: indole-3-glycerol phosphate synthase TrpC [Clostridiales bacterium]|nr:indole-3-glycerol phosphate synthase TrpC [Clostridiales bacterium]